MQYVVSILEQLLISMDIQMRPNEINQKKIISFSSSTVLCVAVLHLSRQAYPSYYAH